MKDENRAQKRQHLPSRQRVARIVYSRVCPKFQFQKNFNLQLAFFKFFYVSSSGSSSSSSLPVVRSTAAVTQPEPQTTKTPTDAMPTDGRTDADGRRRSRLVEEAQKNLELAAAGRHRAPPRITTYNKVHPKWGE